MRKKSLRGILGRHVRGLRKKRGWTQKELARRSGISERYVQRIEGKEPPDVTIDIIAKIGRAFKLPSSDMLRDL